MTVRQGLTVLALAAVMFFALGLALVTWAPAEGDAHEGPVARCTTDADCASRFGGEGLPIGQGQ